MILLHLLEAVGSKGRGEENGSCGQTSAVTNGRMTNGFFEKRGVAAWETRNQMLITMKKKAPWAVVADSRRTRSVRRIMRRGNGVDRHQSARGGQTRKCRDFINVERAR